MVLNALGPGQCQAYWNRPLPKDLTAKNVLLSKSMPTLWRFEYPGVVLNVPNTYSVRTEHTSEGITETSTWHLGIVGNVLNWFPSACSD